MAISKVIFNNTVQMDVTDTTAVPDDVETGKYFTQANGIRTAGTGGTNIKGSGTTGYLMQWAGQTSATNGPQLGSSTATYLRNDGTWAAPVGTTYSSATTAAAGLMSATDKAKINSIATSATINKNIIDGSGSSALTQLGNLAQGSRSFAIGQGTTAVGTGSHAQGYLTYSQGDHSHAEGYQTSAYSQGGHSEGIFTMSTGQSSHAEGEATSSIGDTSHAEGSYTIASGKQSHAEGYRTFASSTASHAQGYMTTASGSYSHAEGYNTIANQTNQTVVGKYNSTANTNAAFIVGNGTATSSRKNAFSVDWSGNTTAAGKITAGATATNANDVPTLAQTTALIPTIPTNVSAFTNDAGYLTSYTETDPTVPSWAKASSKPSYTASEVGAASSSHTHGNITNAGDITATATIASGDRLVINDQSASKITNSSITFGTATNTFLRNDGSWAIPPSQEGGDVNQNAFSFVAVGSSTIAADSETDTLILAEGKNITLTPDTSNNIITIAATNSTYTNATTAAAGLMSASDKQKLNSIASSATDNKGTVGGTGTNGYLAKWNGTTAITNGPQLGSSTTTYLRNDGSWAAPVGTTYSNATTATAGLLSTTDKKKLDSIASSAQVNPTFTAFTGKPTSNLTPSFGDSVTISQISQSTSGQVSGTDRTLTIPSAVATTAVAGLMSSTDKQKLNSIASSATVGTINNNIIDGSGSSALHQINSYADRQYSFAEGYQTSASSYGGHSEGFQSRGLNSTANHAEGYQTTASGSYGSHSEGGQTLASGTYSSHAEGYQTTASGVQGSHAEGFKTQAGQSAHSEGCGTIALGTYSHTQGYNTSASGYGSHAEGARTTASGDYSHAGGYYTIANQDYQTAIGKYNSTADTNAAFIVGNGTGTSDTARKNALYINWDGGMFLSLSDSADEGTDDYELYTKIVALSITSEVIV